MRPVSLTDSCLLVLMLLPMGACVAPVGTRSPEDQRPSIGVEIGEISYWSAQWLFVDAFKQSMPWRSQDKDQQLDLDARGWVRSLQDGQGAWTVMFLGQTEYPAGDYVCLYDGKGDLAFEGDARAVESTPGRMVVRVRPGGAGIKVVLKSTDPEDYLRDVRLIMPEFADTYEEQPFYPRFLKLLDGFDLIRFSGLLKAPNTKVERNWGSRVTPNHQTQAGARGMAVEYAVALCKEVGADAWFVMPVNADADYFRSFAGFVKEHLPPPARVYVEYGDDVGVWPTPSSQYCLARGREQKLSEDWAQARNRYYAARSAEMFAVWNEVFDGDDRLVTVLNPISDDTCTWADAAKGADAAGMVTLFGSGVGKIENIDHLLSTDTEQLMDELEDAAHVDEGVIEEIARARRFGLEPVSFYMTPIICPLGPIEKEKGKEVLQQVMAKTVAMQDHPRMEGIFRKYIKSWHDAGGGLWVHNGLVHGPTQWGWFGLLKNLNEEPEDSPKFRAVRREMEER